ncbi:MAG: hypothetical protein ACI8Z5_001153 [Lentimonas sp.]
MILDALPNCRQQRCKYERLADSKRARANILLVLNARIKLVPAPYKRVQIAQTSSSKLLDVMTAGGLHGQVEGFYRDANGAGVLMPGYSSVSPT